MKAIIKKIKIKNNAQVNADVEIRDDDGTLVYKGNRGFICLDQTTKGILVYLKDSLRNIGNQEKSEKASKLKQEIQSLVGKEIDLD